jgi:hypothetical protein
MRTLISIGLILTLAIPAAGWGEKGHLMVNRLAIEAAAPMLPEFMNASREHLTYNGYEPDRWEQEGRIPLNVAQAPDHFMDSELWGSIATIEPDRYAFMEKLIERKIPLDDIGYLPYSIVENYGRLRNAFRQWRNAKTPEDRESARANAVFFAGLMGHYVGDASQPLHTSIHYNGWSDRAPNPKNYTKDRTLHRRYESLYVNSAIEASGARPNVKAPRRLDDVFTSVKDYLSQSFSELEPLYELEKSGEFNPESPRSKGTAFIQAQIGRAATMLASLWYTAWIESGEPVPAAPRE